MEITKTSEMFYAGELEDKNAIRKIIGETKGYRCEECDIASWNGKPLAFQVNHINGLENDNSPENLRLICANCRSQIS